MVGNFLEMRYAMGSVLGLKEEFEYKDFFFMGKSLDPNLKYPTLEEMKASFHKISPLVYERLLSATDEELDKAFPIDMNADYFEENIINFIGMCIGREDYMCGQIGLMRRILGYPSMKVDFITDMKY